MEEKKGIEASKKLLDLGFAFGGAFKKSLADGKIGPEDVQHLIPVIPTFIPFIESVGEIPAEIKDYSAEEGAELLAYGASKLGGVVDSERLTAQVQAALKLGLAAIELFKTFK